MKQHQTEDILEYLGETGKKSLQFIKWIIVSGFIGVVVGLIGTAFSYGMKMATSTRTQYPQLMIGLPAAGLVIVFLYHLAHRENDKGTDGILSAVSAKEELTIVTAPLIFVSTILTHLFGGSAGREGAALQLGGSIGYWFGKIFRMNKADYRIMTMCGMSACFSALFGTPMAAAIFPMEVVCVGIMQYSALVPCAFSSLIAAEIAKMLGVGSEAMVISTIPEFTWITGGKTVLLAILCAAVSAAFCIILHLASSMGKQWMPNPYIRIAVMGTFIILLTALLRTTDYMGAGMDVIERCISEEQARPEAFLLKMILTALTLGAGYKGGEIVPSFFIGSTFGCVMSGLMRLSPSLGAAVGMIAVFCGVTNSPITALLLALELFGMEAFPYFLLGVAISYMLSGNHSLYQTQRIVYSKYKAVNMEKV